MEDTIKLGLAVPEKDFCYHNISNNKSVRFWTWVRVSERGLKTHNYGSYR